MTEIEAWICRKRWFQCFASISLFEDRNFELEISTFSDATTNWNCRFNLEDKVPRSFCFLVCNVAQLLTLQPIFESESKISSPIFLLGENSIFWGILKRTLYKATGLAKIYRKFLWKLLYGFGSQNEVKKYINKFSRFELSSIHALDF